VTSAATPLGLGVLASGRGSNLQAILEACARPGFPARVVVVVSDRERAQALDRARAVGVEARFVNPKDFPDREAYDLALVRELEARRAGLVCLAGFMRILTAGFVRAYAGRILNVHPSLLPAFPGLDAQKQAFDYGAKVAGCSVHFVDEAVDHGVIILQKTVPVNDDDTAETLSARILEQEHLAYPEAIARVLSGDYVIRGRRYVRRNP